jgi:hypothetical protein
VERLLIFIKHHFGFLWRIIEWGNGFLLSLFYKSGIEKVLPGVFEEFTSSPFLFRRLTPADIEPLYDLIRSQPDADLTYFNPHGFDLRSLQAQLKKSSFLMMGAFEGDKMVGYFFLRFFFNRKCFVGRLIDKDQRGKGIGLVMNKIMYETAWRMHFRCQSTISKNNAAVMKAHSKNMHMVVLKELQNDYLLVEFVKKNKQAKN